jgi:hypothetical protein
MMAAMPAVVDASVEVPVMPAVMSEVATVMPAVMAKAPMSVIHAARGCQADQGQRTHPEQQTRSASHAHPSAATAPRRGPIRHHSKTGRGPWTARPA